MIDILKEITRDIATTRQEAILMTTEKLKELFGIKYMTSSPGWCGSVD